MGNRLEIQLTAGDTAGSLCVVVDHPPPEFTLVPHRHRGEDETIHIVDGSYELLLDGATRTLGPGDTVHVPRGTTHAIRNTSDSAGHRVLVFHPAGIEGFFLAAGTLTPDERPDPARLAALADEHGWELVR
jgi:quercetin dioxygenase-like cupin family protein